MGLGRIVAEHVVPKAPPAKHIDRVVYGLFQPLLGARRRVSDRPPLRAALVPAGLLAAFCAVVAVLGAHPMSAGTIVRRFYTTFAVLAPVPSVVLASHYARLAVMARHKLGFSRAE